jgi:plasmid stabilization system protein ParE
VRCRLVASYVSKTFDPVATVVLAEPAVANLDHLILARSRPAATRARVRASLEPLASFPLIGSKLEGRWDGFRFILGPWPWMLLVYAYDETKDEVGVATIADSRSARAATSQRQGGR